MSTFDAFASQQRSQRLFEPEVSRLQREIEHFSHSLEQERRDSMLVDEQIRRLKKEIAEKKGKRPKTASIAERKAMTEVKWAEKKLESEMVKVNKAQSDNRYMRDKIDEQRNGKLKQIETLERLNKEIELTKFQYNDSNSKQQRLYRIDRQQQRQITLLRSKSAKQEFEYAEQVQSMQSIIKQDRTVIGRQVKNIEETIQKHLKKSPEILDPTTILNALGTKWSEKVSAKKKEIDSYLRYLHQIEGSFRAIQHATGIADINQFVTIFLKSEDQQHSLYMYVDSLNSEIDSLEEDIRHLKDAIAKCTKDKEVGNVTADNDLTDIQEKITKAEIKLESKLNNLEKVKYQLKAIEKPLDHIINQFEESELELKVASPVKVNEHTQQDDLMPLIASCEEYINTLETYLAYKNKEKLAAVKVVPHDQMKAKDFEKVPITIKDILEMGGLLEDEEVEEAKTPLSRKRIRDIAKVITDQQTQSYYLPQREQASTPPARSKSVKRGTRRKTKVPTLTANRSFV